MITCSFTVQSKEISACCKVFVECIKKFFAKVKSAKMNIIYFEWTVPRWAMLPRSYGGTNFVA
jgi:hypothetical protein